MNRSARAVLSLLAVLATSMPSVSVRAQGMPSDAAVRKLAADWLGAWNAHDVEAVMALFAEPHASMINGGMFTASRDSMRTYIKSQMDGVISYDTKVDRTNVVWLNPTTALVQATYSAINSLKDGRTLQWRSNAHLTMLVERQGGAWRIVTLHGSAGSGTAVPK